MLKHGYAYIIGGGVNIPPQQFLQNVGLIQLGGQVTTDEIMPAKKKTGSHQSSLDYFAVSNLISHAVTKVETNLDAPPETSRA
eukprot:1142090-Pyramimonas_sp.AAC.1